MKKKSTRQGSTAVRPSNRKNTPASVTPTAIDMPIGMVSIPRYLAIKLARKTLNAIEDEAGKNKYDKKTHSLGFVHQAIKDTVEKIFTGDSDEESLRRILEEADNYHAMNEAVFPSEIISIEEPYCYAKRILEEDENKRRERTKELQNEIDEMIVVDRTEIGGTDWETGNR